MAEGLWQSVEGLGLAVGYLIQSGPEPLGTVSLAPSAQILNAR
jgi:hypothetical protein